MVVWGRGIKKQHLVICCHGKEEIGGIEWDEWPCLGREEIWINRGGMAVPRSQVDRLNQAYYVYRNTEALSRTHCCSDKIISIKYF